jgi:hypothetical protein
MKKTITLLLITLLIFISITHSQPIQKSDSVPAFEKARYLKGDLEKSLTKKTMYPLVALQSGIQGDVVFSFNITKEGKLENILMVNSMNVGLSPTAYNALSQLDQNWVPAKENGKPIEKKYTIVFRFRLYTNTKPADPKDEAAGYVKRKKYDKALKSYNEAIDDNAYNYQLFESRAQVKELLGDIEGSKQDQKTAKILSSDVMSVANIVALGVIRQAREQGFITTRVRVQ